jgi:hypothetical protein
MNGPEHYREAERLLAAAQANTDHYYGEQDAVPTLLAAVAHALLANAAGIVVRSSGRARTEPTRGAGVRVPDEIILPRDPGPGSAPSP